MKLTPLLIIGALGLGSFAVQATGSAASLPECSGGRVVTRYFWRTASTRPTSCDLDGDNTLSIRVPVRDASDRPLQRAYHVLMDYGCAPQARLVVLNGQLFEVGDRCDF